MIDRILMLIEIALLIRILIQGEYVVYYERAVYKLASSREKERLAWRDRKRAQVIKRLEVPIVQPDPIEVGNIPPVEGPILPQ